VISHLYYTCITGATAFSKTGARCDRTLKGKGKGFTYSIPSVGPGADPGVQAVSPQV